MNFLAHLYLSPPSPAARVGNLLPDLARLRGRALADADRHPELIEGIRNHRRVDAFTDAHPLFARSKRRIFETHGRFSGIVVDMLYDHLLARDWRRYHPQPLDRFSADVYQALASHTHLMPQPMPDAIAAMARQDWLCAYARVDGLALTLSRMSRRFTQRFGRSVDLTPAMAYVDDPSIADDFHQFFPQLIHHVRPSRPAPPRDRGGAQAHHSMSNRADSPCSMAWATRIEWSAAARSGP